MEQRVAELLAKMSLEEKVGQMTQISIHAVTKKRSMVGQNFEADERKLREALQKYHVGSILNVHDLALSLDEWHEFIGKIQQIAVKETRLGIPVMYGIDAIHGANYTREATLFPQSIAMAATRNPELLKRTAAITALELRASGIPWNFNPVLDIGRTPLWPRLWETFGEDAWLASVMGEAYVKGLEGDDNDISRPDKVAGCLKHFIGYGAPMSGKDRTPAWIPERKLRDLLLPPFARAVAAGVHTIMINSGDVNGIPVHSDFDLLNGILREELGFAGIVVSDWQDIQRLHTRDGVAETPAEAVRMAVMAGVDMSMVPFDYSFHQILVKLVNAGTVPRSRIDEAVSRILRVKLRLGLFERPFPDTQLKARVGTADSAAVSKQAALECLTLLKNQENILPLRKDMKVLVTGPSANLRRVLNGGWSYTWQGNVEEAFPESQKTILQAVRDKIGAGQVSYAAGSEFESSSAADRAAAVDAAKEADVIIACIGEDSYCETVGNINDLRLSAAQTGLVEALNATGKPVVLVLVQGRPRVISGIARTSAAILMAYLPGPYGADAISDALFGDFSPCGKLPITYPEAVNSLVCYDHVPQEADDANKLSHLYPFGHGLSYTTFEYRDLRLSSAKISRNSKQEVRVTVRNTGKRAGRVSVELYLSDLFRSIAPPLRQLKRFKSSHLECGEEQTFLFKLTDRDYMFHGRDNRPVVEAGRFRISIGDLSESFELIEDESGPEIWQT